MITVKQYKIALNKLSTKQFQILQKLYEIEPVENSVKIAEELGYKNWGGANYTQGLIDNGYYKANEVSIYIP